MWMPVFGPLPKPHWFTAGWKVGYVVAVRFTGAVLGNVLMWSGTVLYTIYAPGERHWHISPLTDQSIAGVIMMVEGTFLALGVLAWVFFEVAREGIEKQRLLDLAHDRGVTLDERRAQRAVAAGHGARLEQRILGHGARSRRSGRRCRLPDTRQGLARHRAAGPRARLRDRLRGRALRRGLVAAVG